MSTHEDNLKTLKRIRPSLAKMLNDIEARLAVLTLRVDDLNASSNADDQSIADLWLKVKGLEENNVALGVCQVRHNTAMLNRFEGLVKDFDGMCSQWKMAANDANVAEAKANRALTIATDLQERMDGHTMWSAEKWEDLSKQYRIERKAQDALGVRVGTLERNVVDLNNDVPAERKLDTSEWHGQDDVPPMSHNLKAVIDGMEKLLNKSDLWLHDEKLYFALHYWIGYGKRCLKE